MDTVKSNMLEKLNIVNKPRTVKDRPLAVASSGMLSITVASRALLLFTKISQRQAKTAISDELLTQYLCDSLWLSEFQDTGPMSLFVHLYFGM